MRPLRNISKVASPLVTAALLLLGSFGARAATHFSKQCSSVFHANSALLIPMNPQYRGEDQGLYKDPLTGQPWKVKYFRGTERQRFELRLKDGFFLDSQGRKFETEFDSENSEFKQGLLVIDKDFRFYLLPFESRGEYHHSSLSRGEDVIFAGTASFVGGTLREISNMSGHYKPDGRQTLKVLTRLKDLGARLEQTHLTGQAAMELTGSHSASAREIKSLIDSTRIQP